MPSSRNRRSRASATALVAPGAGGALALTAASASSRGWIFSPCPDSPPRGNVFAPAAATGRAPRSDYADGTDRPGFQASQRRTSDAGEALSGAPLAMGTGTALGALCAISGTALRRRKAEEKKRISVRGTAVEDRLAAVEAAEEAEAKASKFRGLALPIVRLVGLEDIKLALRLACIDPSLGGVGIRGGHGTAKTTLARSLRAILPRIEVVRGSVCNLDPNKKEEWDVLSKQRMLRDEKGDAQTTVIDCPFVELPLGCTEDRLVGSLDVQASMDQGKPVFEPGLLAKAHRGVLYIDDVNLLQDDLVSLLLTAVESGVNRVEREGLSVAHPCRPLVIATWNPEEGDLRPHLVDRLAVSLSTDLQTVYTNIEERIIAVDSTVNFAETPEASMEESQMEISSLQTQLLFARESLDEVVITEDQLRRLAEEAARGQCEGHRAEVFAAKIARAHAALNGRDQCDAEDIKQGIKLAIVPRVRVAQSDAPPEEEMQPPPPPPPQEEEQGMEEDEVDEDEAEEDETEDNNDDQNEEEEEEDEDQEMEELPEEFMIDPEGAIVDDDLLKFSNKNKKQGRSGARSKIYSMDRGRYVKAMLPKGGDTKSGKIALDATLRTAVVFQKIRREEARKKRKPEDLKEVYVERSDIWVKKMARKAGALVIFIVDASGSMALNRMQNAKGAVLRLLESAYQSRDQVCLIPCRGIRADILVPPTSSVARASNSMQVLPCGGGTPLAHALQQAIMTASNAIKASDVGQVCIVSITDGRANVPLAVSEGEDGLMQDGKMKKVPKEELQDEVFAIADKIRGLGFKFLLIDTENKYVSSGIAKKLADRAAGKYYYLPRADEKDIATIAGDAVMEMKAL